MRRSLTRSRYAFPVALVVTVALAVMPTRWQETMRVVPSLVSFPLMPLQDLADRFTGLIRPELTDPTLVPSDASLEQLYEENESWRRRFREAELEIRRLEGQLEQLRRLPFERFGVPVRTINARITGHNPKQPHGAVDLNRGRNAGVRPGAIAVFNGVHIVGRVTDVAALRSTMVPLTSRTTDLLDAVVMPAARPDLPIEDAPAIQLSAVGDGTFVADASGEEPIAEGDAVLLVDGSEAWSLAQAMVVGAVRSIGPKDDNPLRHRLLIHPTYPVHRLSTVTLVMPGVEGVGSATP